MSQLATLQKQTPLKILVVEDNEDDFLLLSDFLKSNGVATFVKRVWCHDSLLEALKESWDIVLSDYSMPNFSGRRALDVVRQVDRDVPFVFVSGTIGEEAAVEAIRSGAQDYVMKTHMARLIPTLERELRDVELRKEKRKAEENLRKLSMAINQTADSVFICNDKGVIEYVNPAFESMTGYSAEEAIGEVAAIFYAGGHTHELVENVWATLRRGEVYSGQLVSRRKDGSLFHEEKVITPLPDQEGKITHYVSTGRDISARIAAEQARERLANTLEATPDMVVILAPEGNILYLNKAGLSLLGLTESEDVTQRHFSEVFPDPLQLQFNTQILSQVYREGSWMGESALRIDGVEVPVSLVVLGSRDNDHKIAYYSLIARDLSERKQFESELQRRATHDNLTELPNRYYLMERLKLSLSTAKRKGKRVALLFLDMDKFKRVNDSMGHSAGDQLLKSVADAFCQCLRPGDTVARLGGDEFTIIIEDLHHSEDVVNVLGKLYRVFSKPFLVQSQELFVTFSTGIAIYPDDGTNEADLLRHADIAMYRAKAMGANQYQFFAADMDSRGREILELEAQLQYALENNEFELYYQPQIDLEKDQVIGLEALIRWNHSTLGLVPPSEFVPLLESSGLIYPVGEWIIRQACAQYHRLCSAGFPGIRISVNVSSVQFRDPAFKSKIIAILDQANMPRQILELEITENIVMQDPQRAADILREMHALGVRTAIDDFGTGYSSLAYLKRFPLNSLKIDQTFIRDLLIDPNDAAIVEASISLGRKLGLEVIAEGVETEPQMAFLRQHNCDVAQGYWISRPCPEAAMMAFLREGGWKTFQG